MDERIRSFATDLPHRTIYDQLGRVGDPEQQTIYKQRYNLRHADTSLALFIVVASLTLLFSQSRRDRPACAVLQVPPR